jgi:hypothetical protein
VVWNGPLQGVSRANRTANGYLATLRRDPGRVATVRAPVRARPRRTTEARNIASCQKSAGNNARLAAPGLPSCHGRRVCPRTLAASPGHGSTPQTLPIGYYRILSSLRKASGHAPEMYGGDILI